MNIDIQIWRCGRRVACFGDKSRDSETREVFPVASVDRVNVYK